MNMTHPTEKQLQELKALIKVHDGLLTEYLEEEASSLVEVERSPELVAAEIAMAEAFLGQSYELRVGPENGEYISFPYDVYAVHAYYLYSFDNGKYDATTGTWSPELGEVPEWALVQIYPVREEKEIQRTPQPISPRLVVAMWLKGIIDRCLLGKKNSK